MRGNTVSYGEFGLQSLESGWLSAEAIEEYWAAVVKAGMILFEVSGVPEAAARDCLARVAYKMPFRCRFVTRRPNI
jgi:large subunit ribosomal protein L16